MGMLYMVSKKGLLHPKKALMVFQTTVMRVFKYE